MAESTGVPRRKKHKNSKLGCATCKRRRVKCSEDLPACTNCDKHGTRCDYLDYTPRQLQEFKKAKLEHARHDGLARSPPSADPRSSADSVAAPRNPGMVHRNSRDAHDDGPPALNADSPGRPRLHGGASYTSDASGSPANSALGHAYGAPRSPLDAASHTSPAYGDFGGPAALTRSLSASETAALHLQRGVTRDFDNLLSTQEQQIIYPVYSIPSGTGYDWKQPRAGASYAAAAAAAAPPPPVSPYHVHSPPFRAVPAARPAHTRALPNAVVQRRAFPVLKHANTDFISQLYKTLGHLAPLIASGCATLPQIRDLYHLWLGFFISNACTRNTMFSCLLNLTTNFLITNVFRARSVLSDDARKLRNTLVMHSIEHYALVIKKLRLILKEAESQDLAASVSYILSLMSIYDPEATIHSTNCFRDGMFSILSYSLHLPRSHKPLEPDLIPIHLRLVSNITRTVYLPAYHPAFLDEYEAMLARFGSLLHSVKPADVTNPDTFAFVKDVYEDLYNFCHETVHTFVPEINSHLDDIPYQASVFFAMFRRWANHTPSRLLVGSSTTDPLERVLNLFHRSFRKSAFAALPQVKFCFLRDFDSPLMLDVFTNNNDVDVFFELDAPQNLCISPEAYKAILCDLKPLAAYAIRLITFLTVRISILYKNLVYNANVQLLYPIDNVLDWRDSIEDIHELRTEFQEKLGLREHSIKSFNSTYICNEHYPKVLGAGYADNSAPCPTAGPVDLMSITRGGLLADDEFPSLDPVKLPDYI